MSTSTHSVHPPTGEWSALDSCPHCERAQRDLRRIRAERNALLVRIYELENGSSVDFADPGDPPGGDLPDLMDTPRLPPDPPEALVRRRHRAADRRPLLSAPPHAPQGAPLDFTEPERAPPRVDARSPMPPMMVGGVISRDQGLDFGAVARLTPDELDGLPYGLITLDASGRVIHYNDTESRLAGLPQDRVIGRNFFQEVAPCTRVREFEGRFRELARDPTRVRVQAFDFAFGFSHSEQHVSIVMTPARRRGQFHLALLRRSIRAR